MGVTLLTAEAAATATHAHLAGKHRRQHLESLARARMLASRSDGAHTPALATLDADPVLATLTSREREVIELAGQGLSNR